MILMSTACHQGSPKPARLQAGISCADRVVTVSPGYAWEIQTPEGGWGMEHMLRSRSYALNGVLNGVDLVDWDPQTAPHIVQNYGVDNIKEGKAACKAALQKELGLPERPEVRELCCRQGRTMRRKGCDLSACAAALAPAQQQSKTFQGAFLADCSILQSGRACRCLCWVSSGAWTTRRVQTWSWGQPTPYSTRTCS